MLSNNSSLFRSRFLLNVITGLLGSFSFVSFSISLIISANRLSSFTEDSKIVKFAKKLVTDLYNFRIESFINFWRKNKDLFPESTEEKFDELTDT
ncbi:unnamed protein product, partial [marine sediment metagenome]